MHGDLYEDGVAVSRHRVARLMQHNGIKALQKRRRKKTTDSKHGGLIAPTRLIRILAALVLIRSGVSISVISGRKKHGFIWPLCWTCIPDAWSGWERVIG
jgi:transposase InsO family protein